MPDSALAEVLDRLRRAVQRRFGTSAHTDDIGVATLGGSNRTILFDLVDGATRRRLVFRQETYRLAGTPFISPHDQFALLEVAHAHGIPVPEPVFELDDEDGLGRGYVVAFVAGETMPKRLLSDPTFAPARTRFAREAGAILARLHGIDPGEAAFLESSADSVDPLAAQRARYDGYGERHLPLEVALRWLDTHRPRSARRCIVHGDFRNGNMILDSQGIRAVLDWECAHLGSPMADLGWLCLRSWRFGRTDRHVGGLGERRALYDAYTAGGGTVEEGAVKWWEIFGFVRWAILNIMQAHGHVSGGRRSPAFAACGRNSCMIEYDLLMTLLGRYN